jgi:adenine-specific DNA-methyltransferase
MTTNLLEPRKALNKAFLKIKPSRSHIESFKTNLIQLLDHCNEKETEEFHKNLVIDFLKKTYYDPNYYVNTKGRNDLVIHNGKDAKTNVGVIIEAKSPTNKSEMISVQNLNGKALQELVLYYMRERITHKNTELKHLVVTNIYEWFVFDAQLFNKIFAENKSFTKNFIDFEEGRLSGNKTDYFYTEIAKPFIETLKSEIAFAYFDIRKYNKQLRNADKEDDKSLVALFKLISPEHLLKLSFANDSNTLDKNFYSELLHIIGLTEIKEGGKKLIQRHKKEDRNPGSLLENAIVQLDSLDKISRLQNAKQYGETNEERLFTVALELTITWVNRILFLKLLEAQLITYHKGDRSYSFLNGDLIAGYDSLNSLFFEVLARKPEERNDEVKMPFAKVPYLNSSLFEPTDLEHDGLFVSQLKPNLSLKLLSATVIKDAVGKKETGSKDSLNYFFSFLDAYDFASEGSEDIQEDNKTLINASVLGLIFEKINGYKDGSFFTPSFITMYMCKETIRRAVVQKFNETKNWNCTEFEQLYDKIEDRKEANDIINSLKICDPAVGSGHFLVSALNEIIAIKNDLRVLQDHNGNRLKEYHFEVVNDELIVTDEDGIPFSYNPKNKESQRIQETLFHEKQTIIENCLFGVDINPNSVKICRLRLWIELLKNAYYRPNTNELETLPNIDINIKCGNSLISRFALDADLKKALKQSKWNVESYKIAVDTYRNAESKEQKREMERLIADIKGNFRSEIATNDPKKIKLEKLKGELFNLTQQTGLFERSKKEQTIWNKKVNELAVDTKKLDTEIEEIKSNKIYENAFEWRFEFPDVLNDNGDFVGFDVVIGNPPYGVNLKDQEIEYYRKSYNLIIGHSEIYYMFIELGLSKLLKSNQFISYIIPNAWLSNKYAKEVRKSLIKDFDLIEIINFNQKVIFEDAQVETSIISVRKSNLSSATYVGQTLDVKYQSDNNLWLNNENYIINFSENKILQSLLIKISNSKNKISDFFDITNGCKPYQAGYGKNLDNIPLTELDVKNRIYHSDTKLNDTFYNELKGKNINSYYSKESNQFIKWGNWLMSSKDKKYYFQPKILIRQIIGKSFIANIDNSNSIADQSLYICIPLEENNEISLKFGLGIINSKLYGFYFRKFYSEEDNLFPKIKVNELKNLPFTKPNDFIKNFIEDKVDEILTLKAQDPQADTQTLEEEIDAMVYELYGLSEEEIKIVENS